MFFGLNSFSIPLTVTTPIIKIRICHKGLLQHRYRTAINNKYPRFSTGTQARQLNNEKQRQRYQTQSDIVLHEQLLTARPFL